MLRRGVIAVHGLGEQPKGDTLNYVGRPLVDFIQEHLGGSLVKEVRFNPASGPPRAILRFGQGAQEEEWTIAEAWWARSFIPSKKEELLPWALRLGFRRMGSIFYGIALRPVLALPWFNRLAGPGPGGAGGWLAQRITAARVGVVPWPGASDVYWRRPRSVRSRLLWDPLVGFTWLCLLLAAYLVSPFLMLVLFILGHLPLIKGAVGSLQKAFSEFLVQGLGDLHAVSRNPLARDSASTTILDLLQPWVDPGHASYQVLESVTVIAHSGGAVVAFDALTSPELKGWLAKLNDPRPALTLYTLGSGLNATYSMERGRTFAGQTFPDRVRWVDLWAQYDPIPAGPPHPSLRGLSGCREFVDLRVSNHDNPVDDHGTYFENREEVLARLLEGILRGRSAPPPLLADAVQRSIEAIPKHRRGVATRAGLRILMAVLAVGLALLGGLHQSLVQFAIRFLPEDPGWLLEPLISWLRRDAGGSWIWFLLWLGVFYILWKVADLLWTMARRP